MNVLHEEYDSLMLGRIQKFSNDSFGRNNPRIVNERNALDVMRYAFSKYLEDWSIEKLMDKLDKDILKSLKLNTLVKYVEFPEGYTVTDYYYLVSKVYKSRHISFRDKVSHVMEKVLSGEINSFPRDFFVGSVGKVRAGFCLQYVIENYLSYETVEDLYFTFYQQGSAILKKYHLSSLCMTRFSSPVEFLHYSLPSDLQDEFLFRYYHFYLAYGRTHYKKKLNHQIGSKRKITIVLDDSVTNKKAGANKASEEEDLSGSLLMSGCGEDPFMDNPIPIFGVADK